jgi:hypothetical protein
LIPGVECFKNGCRLITILGRVLRWFPDSIAFDWRPHSMLPGKGAA